FFAARMKARRSASVRYFLWPVLSYRLHSMWPLNRSKARPPYLADRLPGIVPACANGRATELAIRLQTTPQASHSERASPDVSFVSRALSPGRCGVSPLEGVAEDRHVRAEDRGKRSPPTLAPWIAPPAPRSRTTAPCRQRGGARHA